MASFVETGWVAPLIELVKSGEIVQSNGSMVFDTVVEESVALKPGFGIFARGRIHVETGESNQSLCERGSNKNTSSTVSLRFVSGN